MKHSRVFGAAVLALMVGGTTIAQAQDRGRGDDRGRQNDQGRQDDKGRRDDRRDDRRVSDAEQQQRIQAQQARDAQYRAALDRQVIAAQQHNQQLEAARRAQAYQTQQEYAAALAAQQQRLRAQRTYNNDPYMTTPHSYRYMVSGAARQTNQYGVDVLKAAVNNGYSRGVRAGAADRADGQRASYTSSFAYRDANYGYDGQYISQSDYNYYFRQGFRRGYDDGYNSRSQYGTNLNGTPSLLGNLLTNILGLTTIH